MEKLKTRYLTGFIWQPKYWIFKLPLALASGLVRSDKYVALAGNGLESNSRPFRGWNTVPVCASEPPVPKMFQKSRKIHKSAG
ncbi:MAG TPA: hypothetical protein VGO50_14570 [Pyrinomonadaceae bacterium]|jgi:hypothetical protein|nr:hypothetical protein [Pyrinomonadaceae bacterium]